MFQKSKKRREMPNRKAISRVHILPDFLYACGNTMCWEHSNSNFQFITFPTHFPHPASQRHSLFGGEKCWKESARKVSVSLRTREPGNDPNFPEFVHIPGFSVGVIIFNEEMQTKNLYCAGCSEEYRETGTFPRCVFPKDSLAIFH